jgi:trk system potassium uptake protein TrkA
MNIIVVGCGRVGAELAYRLYRNGQQVVVIDTNSDAFHGIPEDFSGRMIEGDAMNQDVLRRSGIESADGIALVTSSDRLNAIVGHVARTVYEIPVVAVRNFDSRFRSLHEAFGHNMVSSSSWGAQRIEELLYDEKGNAVFSAGNGEVELYEFSIPDAWQNRRLNELLPQNDCVVAALTRAGKAFLPAADTVLETGDLLLISATLAGSTALRHRIQSEPA